MNKITDDNITKIWLGARNVSEAALVLNFTSPQDAAYSYRKELVEERIAELLKVLGVEVAK